MQHNPCEVQKFQPRRIKIKPVINFKFNYKAMNKLTVTLDASKLRGLVSERTYKNKEGQEVKVQEVKFDLVPVREPKTVHSSERFDVIKTHFAAEIQTKEQREARAETNFIGEGVTIQWKDAAGASPQVASSSNDDDDLGLPF